MSAGNYLIKEHINRHINFYASREVAARGRILYNENKVSFNEYIEKTDSWKLTVMGSQKYQVNIKGVNAQSIQTSCTCPFDWGSLCKHTVAALHFVSDNLESSLALNLIKQAELPKQTTTRTGLNYGYEIPDYKVLTFGFIQQNASPQVLQRVMYNYNQAFYQSVKISKAQIEFIAQNEINNAIIYYENGQVYITSHDAYNAQKLTFAEAQCLYTIQKSTFPNFLDEVFSGKIFENQKEILKDYGLPEDTDFNTYFSYFFSKEKGLMYYTSSKGAGLVPVNPNRGNYLTDLIHKINHEKLILDKLQKKAEHRELGFVLAKGFRSFSRNSYHNFSDDENSSLQYSIIPIIGKTAKSNPSAFSSGIEQFDKTADAKYIISKTENAKKLLQLTEEIENDGGNNFNLLKKAYAGLLNEKFVFGLAPESNQIRKKDLKEIQLSPNPMDVVFEVSKKDGFNCINMKIKTGDELHKRKSKVLKPADCYFFEKGMTVYFAKSEKVAHIIADFDRELKMVASHEDEFFTKVVEPISKNFKVVFKNGTLKTTQVELDFQKKQVFLSEQDEYMVFTPCVEYGQDVSATLNNTGSILIKNDNEITEYLRNYELENDFLDSLAVMHPDFENQKNNRLFYLHHSDFTKDMWFYRFFDQLQTMQVDVFGLKELKNFRYSPFKGKINTTVTSGQDWFEVNVAVSFGDNQVSLNDIKKAVLNKQRYVQLKDGSVGILPAEWLHKLEKYFRNGEIRKDKIEISKLRFSIIDELFDNLNESEVLKEISEKRQRLKNFTNISETKVPEQMTATLRHYQSEGLNWLNFLDEMQWGGILADDMGLGKTLQILAFLQQQADKKQGTNLVVVPTTLLFNWENELKKFAPKLKALFYYGNEREKTTKAFNGFDLVITTYGLLVRDVPILSNFRFNYVILDESQAIKNPVSHRYKAACLLNARNRIALTGTPIENSTFDLFAQMSFVNRAFFGNMQKFRDDYSTPIDKDGNEVIAAELNRIINPFVLRRTKEKVASELPDKTEDILYCEMEAGQRRVYDAWRNDYRTRLLNKIETEGIEKSKLMVLEALTRLRQICDSPLLLNSEDVGESQSVKIQELVQHITTKTGKHKILIFSQFVKMLGLIKDQLAKLSIEYEYLDGQSTSTQREQSVNHFQENENLRVFLISLKAGGTGLNLTAADYVYIVDPWWNPAVETQAIDRCHRIGQDKKVFAYRMICKNTVEEKILALQDKKKKIAGDIIQSDECVIKKLGKNDIRELFS